MNASLLYICIRMGLQIIRRPYTPISLTDRHGIAPPSQLNGRFYAPRTIAATRYSVSSVHYLGKRVQQLVCDLRGCHGCMTIRGIITHNYYTSSSHYSSIETACRFLGFFRSLYLTHFFVTLQSGMFSQHCHRGLTFFATFPALPSVQAVHLDSHIHRCLLLGSSPSPLIAQKLCG